MSYRIHYQHTRKKSRRDYPYLRRSLLTILCFALFLVLVQNFTTDAIHAVNNALEQLRPALMVSAMDEMAEDFQNGINIQTVIENFFHNLIREAHFASN